MGCLVGRFVKLAGERIIFTSGGTEVSFLLASLYRYLCFAKGGDALVGGFVARGAVDSIRDSMAICRSGVLGNERVISGHFQASYNSGGLGSFLIDNGRHLSDESQSDIHVGARWYAISVGGRNFHRDIPFCTAGMRGEDEAATILFGLYRHWYLSNGNEVGTWL